MTKQEYLDRLKEMHPDASYARIVNALNEAIKDFSYRTNILTGTFTQNTVVDRRYYELDDDIIEIKSVDVNDKVALKLVGRPETRDIS